MAFAPSKTTKSLRSGDFKGLEGIEHSVTAHLQPLKDCGSMFLDDPDYSKFVPVLFDTLSHFHKLEDNEVVQDMYVKVNFTKSNFEQERDARKVFQKATNCKDLQEFYYDFLQESSVFKDFFRVVHMGDRTVIGVKEHYGKTMDIMMTRNMEAIKEFGENFYGKDENKTDVEADGGYESPNRKHVAKKANPKDDEGEDKNGRSTNSFAALEEDEDDDDEKTSKFINGNSKELNESHMSNMTGCSFDSDKSLDIGTIKEQGSKDMSAMIGTKIMETKVEDYESLFAKLEDNIEEVPQLSANMFNDKKEMMKFMQRLNKKVEKVMRDELSKAKSQLAKESEAALLDFTKKVNEKEQIAIDFIADFEKYQKMKAEMHQQMTLAVKIKQSYKGVINPIEKISKLEEQVEELKALVNMNKKYSPKNENGEVDLTSDDHSTSERKRNVVQYFTALDDDSIEVEIFEEDGLHYIYWPHLEQMMRFPEENSWVLVEKNGWCKVAQYMIYSSDYKLKLQPTQGAALLEYESSEIIQISRTKPRFAHCDAEFSRGRSVKRNETRSKRQLSLEETRPFHVKKEKETHTLDEATMEHKNRGQKVVLDEDGIENYIPYKNEYTPVLTTRQYIYPYDKNSHDSGPKITISSYNSSKVATAVALDHKGKNFIDFWKKIRNILQDHGIKVKPYQKLKKDECIFEPIKDNCFNYESMKKESSIVIYEMFNQSKDELIPHDQFLQGQLNMLEENRDGIGFLKDLMETHHPEFKIENCRDVLYGPKFKTGMTIYEFAKDVENAFINQSGGYYEAEYCVYFLKKLDQRFEVGKKELLQRFTELCEKEGRNPNLEERFKLCKLPRTVIKACSSDTNDHNLLATPRPANTLQVNKLYRDDSEDTEEGDEFDADAASNLQINAARYNGYNKRRQSYSKSYDRYNNDSRRRDRSRSYDRYDKKDSNQPQQRNNGRHLCRRCAKLCGDACRDLGLIVTIPDYLKQYGESIVDGKNFRKDLQDNKTETVKRAQRSFHARQELKAHLAKTQEDMLSIGYPGSEVAAFREDCIANKLHAMPDLMYGSADSTLHDDNELMLELA